MNKANPFQIVVIIVFVVILVAAIFVFSNSKSSKTKEGGGVNYGYVSVWGTIREVDFLLEEFNRENEGVLSVGYKYVPIERFDTALLEALADGVGPDALILPNEWLYRNTPRILPIPYDPVRGGVTEREFKDAFIQGSEIYLQGDGILALPALIDPLVMYWNRDMFTNAGVATTPKYWSEFLNVAPKLTKKEGLDIVQGGIGMGEFQNVTNAKSLLALLFLQVGNPLVQINDLGLPESALQSGTKKDVDNALRYYTDFANPLKPIYTWNRSLPETKDAFLAEQLAVYFDFAGKYAGIQTKNSHLNFDIAPMPQTEGATRQVTFGKLHGIATLKSAQNQAGGIAFAKIFSGPKWNGRFSDIAGMAPVRRDLLAVQQTDAFKAIFYDAALKARTWLDPNPVKTDAIFADMVDAVTSGKSDPARAVLDVSKKLDALIDSTLPN